jgi:hypothetical protein
MDNNITKAAKNLIIFAVLFALACGFCGIAALIR